MYLGAKRRYINTFPFLSFSFMSLEPARHFAAVMPQQLVRIFSGPGSAIGSMCMCLDDNFRTK